MQFAAGARGKPGGAEKMGHYRKAKGLSQRDLAHIIGWSSHTYLGRLERGLIKNIDVESALKICVALDLQPYELFDIRSSTVSEQQVVHRHMTQKAA